MRASAIFNPRAGLKARRALDALRRPGQAWNGLAVLLTERPGHARELAREAVDRGDEVVLSVGGDGTANEVASGILGSETALGVVPVGSGNGLARTLRIPLDPRRALDALAHGVVRHMDVGLANGRPFLNVAGAGFDAVIGRDFHDHGEQGGRRGVLTYTWLSLKRVLRYRAESWRLESTAGGFRGRALLVAFVNGRQYGGGAILAPRARLDDGRIEVVVFESAPTLEMIWNAPRLFLGTIEGYSRFRRLSVESAVLTGPPRFLHHRDGEPEGDEERLEVALRPRALPILVPRAVADDPTGPFRTERAP